MAYIAGRQIQVGSIGHVAPIGKSTITEATDGSYSTAVTKLGNARAVLCAKAQVHPIFIGKLYVVKTEAGTCITLESKSIMPYRTLARDFHVAVLRTNGTEATCSTIYYNRACTTGKKSRVCLHQ